MKDISIFEGKNFTDLLKDIHDSTLQKRKRIDDMIVYLKSFINSGDAAVILAPIIKDYLEVMVKNDDHLVKIAAIIQRIIALEYTSTSDGLNDLLSEDEKEKLMASAMKELESEVAKTEKGDASGIITP